MNVFVESVNDRIEDILADEGIPTRCLFLSGPEPAPPEIVFPMGMEAALFRALRSRARDLERYLGEVNSVLPRTILFHLSYEIFGTIPIGPGALLSTNVTNLLSPRVKKQVFVDSSVPAPLAQQRQVPVYSYDVDLIVVGADSAALGLTSLAAREAAKKLNATSRYLRIGRLRVAPTPNRFTRPPEQNYQEFPVG